MRTTHQRKPNIFANFRAKNRTWRTTETETGSKTLGGRRYRVREVGSKREQDQKVGATHQRLQSFFLVFLFVIFDFLRVFLAIWRDRGSRRLKKNWEAQKEIISRRFDPESVQNSDRDEGGRRDRIASSHSQTPTCLLAWKFDRSHGYYRFKCRLDGNIVLSN